MNCKRNWYMYLYHGTDVLTIHTQHIRLNNKHVLCTITTPCCLYIVNSSIYIYDVYNMYLFE